MLRCLDVAPTGDVWRNTFETWWEANLWPRLGNSFFCYANRILGYLNSSGWWEKQFLGMCTMIFPSWCFQTFLCLSIPGEIIQFDYVIFFKRFFLIGGFFNCHLKHCIRWSVLLGQQVESAVAKPLQAVAKKKGTAGSVAWCQGKNACTPWLFVPKQSYPSFHNHGSVENGSLQY